MTNLRSLPRDRILAAMDLPTNASPAAQKALRDALRIRAPKDTAIPANVAQKGSSVVAGERTGGKGRSHKGPWQPWEDEILRSAYANGIPNSEVCAATRRPPQSVRNRAYRLGITEPVEWSEAEIERLKEWYASHRVGKFRLEDLASELGRLKSNVCRKARSLGLTDKFRPRDKKPPRRKYATNEEARAAVGRAVKERLARDGHPRGALGMKHTPETKARLGEKSRARWQSMSQEHRDAHTMAGVRARAAAGTLVGNRPHGSWKAGWREIGGKRHYYRSRWEANYARYLETLKQAGEIVDWEHEPETFWFDEVKRGTRTYLPDFRVTAKDGTQEYHEVKGWMDDRSKTKLRRMATFYPWIVVIVIDTAWFKKNTPQLSKVIPGWETNGKRL